jgi:phosphoribosyl-ATP pyrophosphohydrolase/phosphoribosyl-AMP cyclohydrolase
MRDRNAPVTLRELESLDWENADGLVPAIVQDVDTLQLLMLGYMSRDALAATLDSGLATFHSRKRGALWEKGETSGNRLLVKSVHADCDGDALLIRAEPLGPTCHLETRSCFEASGPAGPGWLGLLSRIVRDRRNANPKESYTARLLGQGPLTIAQKIGEEGVELALAGAAQDKERCVEEAADLLYHLAVLMEARGIRWTDISDVLRNRHEPPAD